MQTENIADGEDVIVTETDVRGTPKTTSGLTMSATKISNNTATATIVVDNTVKAGTYYFKVTCDGITSI